MKKIKVLSVFGTRPEAIKMCPLVKTLESHDRIESIVCVTAQHREMLDTVLEIFKVKPHYDLNIMSHGQTIVDVSNKVLSGVDKVSGLEYSVGEELHAKADQAYNPESANAQSGIAVAQAIANIEVSGGGGYKIGDGLKLDTSTNTLSVDTVDKAEPDNTQPITSAAVFTEIGNINTLLSSI